MTTPQSRPNGESTPSPAVFSYAQAAKGRSTATTISAIQSHQSGASGVSTPAKESASATNTPSAGSERGDRSVNGATDTVTKPDQVGGEVLGQDVKAPISAAPISTPASPSFGTASTATLPREEKGDVDDDDFTLVGPPETTRDRSSQNGGTAVGKSAEQGEGRKGKKNRKPKNADKDSEKEKEKAEVKPENLVPAPLPTVNFWLQRKEEFAKTKPMPVVGQDHLSVQDKTADAKKRSKGGNLEDADKPAAQNGMTNTSQSVKGQKKVVEGLAKSKDDQSSRRTGPRGSRAVDKEDKSSHLPPPVDDAQSWPTPETILEDDKRKALEKVEKVEKDEKDENNQNKSKQKWVQVPFVPSVSFNTPIPPRGGRGRGGVRGGRTEGGRPRESTNGPVPGEKGQTSTTDDMATSVDGERQLNGAARATSLPPPKRQPNDQAGTRKQTAVPSVEKSKGPGAKNEGVTLDARNSSFHPEQFQDVVQDPKQHDANKMPKQDQFQGPYPEPLARGNDRRTEPASRGMDPFRDGINNGKENNHSSRDRVDGRADRGRGGFRGRGGHGNFPNGQLQQHNFLANGHGTQVPNGYPTRQNSAPYSPPLQTAPFANQFMPSSRGRGGGGSRSQSIPNGAMYGRYGSNGAAMSQHIAPLQTSNPMYDYQYMQPLSAAPFNSHVDEASLVQLVTMQLEYYFSIDNLCKDVYLRKHMDSQGFVFLSFIAGFKRIKALTTSFELLRFACQESDIIDLIQGEDGKDRLRRAEGWEKWIMALDDRDDSVRNAGPAQHLRSHPAPKYHQMGQMMMPNHHAMSPLSFSPNGVASNYPVYTNGVQPPVMNGNGVYHPETPLSAAVAEFSPNPYPVNGSSDPLEAETTFQNEEVANLTLVFSPPKHNDDQKSKIPFHNASSRTFSNGSIDSRSIAEEIHDDSHQSRSSSNGVHASESPSPDTLRHPRSPFTSMSPTQVSSNGPPVMWVKGERQQAVVSEHNSQELYTSFRARTLKNRDFSVPGETHPDMNLLYEFWSHFLCRNFNAHMYSEFREFALEDARVNAMSGIKNLISYYDEILNSKKKVIPQILARHYIDLVQQEDPTGERPAFEKLRIAWRNGALDVKSRKQIGDLVDVKLRADLDRVQSRPKSDSP